MEQQSKVTYTRYNGLTLRVDTVEEDYASLTWGSRDGRPRATIYTSKEHRTEDGKIDYDKVFIAPFDIFGIRRFLTYAINIVKNNVGNGVKVECLNNKFKNRLRTKEVITQAVLVFEKTTDGYVFKASRPNDKEYVFKLEPGAWHNYTIDGQEIPIEQQRKTHVELYLRTLLEFIERDIVEHNTRTSDVEMLVEEDHKVTM